MLDVDVIVEVEILSEEKRQLVIASILLASISGGIYDSRVSASLQSLAKYLNIPWGKVLAEEDAIAEALQLRLRPEGSIVKTDNNSKYLKVAIGAVIGGGLLAITGGLAAPAILPVLSGAGSLVATGTSAIGLGVIGSGIVTGGSVLLSGGAVTIGSLFGVAGAGLSGDRSQVDLRNIRLQSGKAS